MLARSSSHPPEMFCWEGPPSSSFPVLTTYVDTETQTEAADCIRQYIVQNPRKVLEILGFDPDKMLNKANIKKSHSIPDYNGRGNGVVDFANSPNFNSFLNYQGQDCYVDVDVEDAEDGRGEDCPFLWAGEERRVQIFESINTSKSQNPLLKFRRNKLE